MTTQTTTLQNSGGQDAFLLHEGYFVRRNVLDWLFAALVLAGGVFAFVRYQSAMDGYEQGEWWVQDAAAAMPVRLFSDLKGKRVLNF